MRVKKSVLALWLGLAFVIGGLGTYVIIEFTLLQEQEDLTNQSTRTTNDEMLADLAESISLPKVSQAFALIQENYIEEISEEDLVEGAVRGMLASLDDPYSEYMDQETMEQFNEQIESSFEGIGAEVSMVDDRVTIVAPIKDSPAEKAGLRPNDQVLTIDGESVEGLDLLEAVGKIRGEKGSEVTIEIQRPGLSDPIEFTLVRDTIPLETVYADIEEVGDNKAGVIQITSFSEQTAERFQEELESLESEGIDGLVIDVRGNPGGLLDVTEDILKLFVTSDQPFMQIADNEDNKQRFFSDLEEPKDYPISVLIDEGSASASEILAISLYETIDAELIGRNSFGKGTVQQTVPMGDGSTIKLTILKWLSPEGNSIHEIGVKPTIEVDQPDYYYISPIQLEETLAYDESDPNIELAQIMLEGLGYKVDRKDGYFSKQTEQAIKSYQTDQDTKVSGVLDQETADLLLTDIIEKIRNEADDLQKEKALEVLFE
ncbi:PDZ domain-containing protein [Amphibacillus sp. MSJ-3]|uniref:S41 family peptidase n=1 Tax=Amphibacillus sp. MSJ-3 TaxID=2841505 RepID=UPI001C0EEFD3|nr:PDZ domain-containing protein [Amphibacillus sp. MSJ-3]